MSGCLFSTVVLCNRSKLKISSDACWSTMNKSSRKTHKMNPRLNCPTTFICLKSRFWKTRVSSFVARWSPVPSAGPNGFLSCVSA